jgi:hypothetical protein
MTEVEPDKTRLARGQAKVSCPVQLAALVQRIFMTILSGFPSSQIGKMCREFERVSNAMWTFLGCSIG